MRGGRFEPFYCNDEYFCHWIQWQHLGKTPAVVHGTKFSLKNLLFNTSWISIRLLNQWWLVVSSIPTGGNLIFLLTPFMIPWCQFCTEMSDFCYLRKPRMWRKLTAVMIKLVQRLNLLCTWYGKWTSCRRKVDSFNYHRDKPLVIGGKDQSHFLSWILTLFTYRTNCHLGPVVKYIVRICCYLVIVCRLSGLHKN